MYWIDVITASGIEARLTGVSDEHLNVLMPLLGELGAAASFGQVGSSIVLGGCLSGPPLCETPAVSTLVIKAPATQH